MEGNRATLQSARIEEFNGDLLPVISQVVDGRIRVDVPASSLTTLAVGGAVRALVTVETLSELQKVLACLRTEGQAVYPFGFGSNMLVDDGGLVGWGIRLGSSFKRVSRCKAGVVSVGGATSLMSVSRRLSDEGLSGLEFAAGIPASVGGAVYMNAGAHGGEVSGCLESLVAVMPDGKLVELAGQEMHWSYRSSGLPLGVVVTEARLRLVPGKREDIGRRCADNLAYRRMTQPLSLPSAGSVFKNPSPHVSAGSLLERAGMKGVSIGGAMVSELHANWIVNPDKKATSADVRSLIELCAARVQEAFGIALHPEVRMWGEFSANNAHI